MKREPQFVKTFMSDPRVEGQPAYVQLNNLLHDQPELRVVSMAYAVYPSAKTFLTVVLEVEEEINVEVRDEKGD